MNHLLTASGAAALAIGSAMTSHAGAATAVRDHWSHGTANCQAALPVFDGNIRKRPLAFANEGATHAFVTCDTDNFSIPVEGSFTLVGMYFSNDGADDAAITCTLVDILANGTHYFPESTGSIPPGGNSFILWSPSSYYDDGQLFRAPAISCNLPPQTRINFVEYAYREDIGA